jgi:hypothetical protein
MPVIRSLHDVRIKADRIRMFVCLSACFNSGTAERILMKFGEHVMPLKATPTSYFQMSVIGDNNMADARTCEVGA